MPMTKRSTVQLTGENLRNLNGRIAGDAIALTARADMDNIGGMVKAGNALLLDAGRDLNVTTTTHSDARAAGRSDFSRTNIDRVAGLYVTDPGGVLLAAAARDVNLLAAQIVNNGEGGEEPRPCGRGFSATYQGSPRLRVETASLDLVLKDKACALARGQTAILAGRDLTLGTVTIAEQENNVRNDTNYLKQGFVQDVGTSIATVGDVRLQTGGNVNASAATVRSEGGDLTWTHTHITAGEHLTLQSGGDTNLRGAVASGKQVIADVGGNLNIESLQDTSTFKSRNSTAGGSVTVGAGLSASANFGQQKIDNDYASVTEQSRIEAGDGSFQISVHGNTDLKGAAITSSEPAILDGVNTLTTATLTASDIQNHAEYQASGFSVGLGYSGGKAGDGTGTDANSGVGTNQQGKVATGGDQVPGSTLPNIGNFSASPPVTMAASGASSSVTHSGISGAHITITNETAQQALTAQSVEEHIASLNRDVHTGQDSANALTPIFNEQEIQAGFEIVAALQRETGTFLNNRAKEAATAQQALDRELAKPEAERNPILLAALEQQVSDSATWTPGGTGRQVLTALTAAAAGNVTGASSQFAQNLVVNYLQQQGASYIGDLVREGTVTEGSATHATLHAIVACAGAIAGSQDCGSGALGAATSSLLTNLFVDAPHESAEQKEAKHNLIATLVIGIVAAADSALPTTTNSAIAAIDNNYLTQQDVKYLATELAKCKADDKNCRDSLVAEAKKRSDENDKTLKACRTTECVEDLISDIFEGVRKFGLLYAADQATDNEQKTAFGEISDIETYSLLLAANMAAGLPIHPGGDVNWQEFITKVENLEFTQGASENTWWQDTIQWYESRAGDTSQPHEYTNLTVACSVSPGLNCGNLSEQFNALLRYAGPGTDGSSLADNGKISRLNN